MEIDCYARVRFRTHRQLELARSLLEVDPECPLFEEEVDESLRETFRELEHVAIPRSIMLDADDTVMTIHWFVPDREDVRDGCNALIRSKIKSLVELDFDDEDNAFGYVYNGTTVERIMEWKGKSLNRIKPSKNIEKLLARIEKKLV